MASWVANRGKGRAGEASPTHTLDRITLRLASLSLFPLKLRIFTRKGDAENPEKFVLGEIVADRIARAFRFRRFHGFVRAIPSRHRIADRPCGKFNVIPRE